MMGTSDSEQLTTQCRSENEGAGIFGPNSRAESNNKQVGRAVWGFCLQT